MRVHVTAATALLPPAAVDVLRGELPADTVVTSVAVPYRAVRVTDWVGDLQDADVLVGFAQQFQHDLAHLPRLRWIQHFGAGYDTVDLDLLRTAGVGLSSASGAGATGIAEFVMLAVLSMARGAGPLGRAQRERRWAPVPSSELAGRRMTVVGAGAIGARVCALAAAFDMTVRCVRARPSMGPPAGASSVHGPDGLHGLLPDTDVLVLAAPLSDSTAGLIGAPALALLPPGALLVNVARAGLLDHRALVDALACGRLGGAWLDVLPTEPLPAADPLWDVPGLVVSPHTAVAITTYPHRVAALAAGAVRSWLAGEPVPTEVLPLPPPAWRE